MKAVTCWKSQSRHRPFLGKNSGVGKCTARGKGCTRELFPVLLNRPMKAVGGRGIEMKDIWRRNDASE